MLVMAGSAIFAAAVRFSVVFLLASLWWMDGGTWCVGGCLCGEIRGRRFS
jgi:hypothetical protein